MEFKSHSFDCNGSHASVHLGHEIRVGSWQNGSFSGFFFEPPEFFLGGGGGFCCRFFSVNSWEKSAQKKSSRNKNLAKGFCRAKFWVKFPFWRGQFGAKFFAKFAAKFFTKFSALFCWDIQSKKTSAKTSALNSHDRAQQNWRNFRKKFTTRFCRGTLAKQKLAKSSKTLEDRNLLK